MRKTLTSQETVNQYEKSSRANFEIHKPKKKIKMLVCQIDLS